MLSPSKHVTQLKDDKLRIVLQSFESNTNIFKISIKSKTLSLKICHSLRINGIFTWIFLVFYRSWEVNKLPFINFRKLLKMIFLDTKYCLLRKNPKYLGFRIKTFFPFLMQNSLFKGGCWIQMNFIFAKKFLNKIFEFLTCLILWIK